MLSKNNDVWSLGTEMETATRHRGEARPLGSVTESMRGGHCLAKVSPGALFEPGGWKRNESGLSWLTFPVSGGPWD